MRGLAALAVVVGALIAARPLWLGAPAEGVIVEVVGEVPQPGWRRAEAPTVHAALRAAGVVDPQGPDQALQEGDRVEVGADGVRVSPGGDPLLVGLPVELNTASAEALAALPGVGPQLAAEIVAERVTNGPFATPDSLVRVPGVSARRVSELRPFLTVDGARFDAPVPVDLNTATSAELEALPGIGPATAARILLSRAEQGPFRSLDDLARVPGVRPDLIERLRGLAEAR